MTDALPRHHLDDDDLASLLAAWGLEAASLTPVAGGIENTNWFVSALLDGTPRELVLTRVDVAAPEELPYFVALVDALARDDLPVPVALATRAGRRQHDLGGRGFLLCPRLPGRAVTVPSPAQCRATGELLARLHAAARHCPFTRERADHLWWPVAWAWLAPQLDAETRSELGNALLAASAAFAGARALPRGTIHGDLFRDNLLFTGNEPTALLDFFHATHDVLAWDIAIALNDFAGTDPERAGALLDGYQSVRALTAAERDLLPALRTGAAARFWLSREIAARKAAGDPREARPALAEKSPLAMRELLRALSAG